MVVTSQPEPAILRQFAELRPQTIEAASDENLNDLRTYARRWLSIESRGAGETEARVERMGAASQGNFLYLRKLTEAATAGLMDLEHPDGLPQGLVGLYERWFRRQFPNTVEFEAYRPFFEVLVAAEHPVPEKWLERILGWSKRDKAKILEQVGNLVERRANGIAPFHKSLRDWLADDRSTGTAFAIDIAAGAKRLVNALWPAFVEWTEDSANSPLDLFCEVELLPQLTAPNSEPGRLEEFARLLSNPDVIRRRMLIDTQADEGTRRTVRHAFRNNVGKLAEAGRKSLRLPAFGRSSRHSPKSPGVPQKRIGIHTPSKYGMISADRLNRLAVSRTRLSDITRG